MDRNKLWRCLEDLGLQGRLVEFLRAAYADLRCEVKVGEEYSEPFVVTNGLRQGCILSPLSFSLYINSLTVELKKAEVGVVCKGWRIPALLYADDMVLLAEEEAMLRKELKILGEWCVEWAVKVNVGKCGIVHFRKRRVKRSEEVFRVNGERIDVIAEYKYLGCVISEHLDGKRMLEERAKAGARALSAWLKRCRATVGVVKGKSFTKLWGALVESVLLYGAEAWGCGRQAVLLEQVQLRAARIFLGVGRLHPKVALQFEMRMMPVIWEAKRRCIEFWLKVLRMSDDRLVKWVVVEAGEMVRKIGWQKDLEQGLEEFGWREVGVEDLGRMSLMEIGHMLRDIAWREVKKGWEANAQERSKWKVLQGLLASGGKARCMDVNCKRQRRVLAKLRGGTAALRIETGRWSGLKREERSCRQCTVEEVEDEEHFLLRCEGWRQERETLVGFMGELEGEF